MSLIQTLGRLDDGFFLGKCTDAQQDLVRAIQDTGKGGKLIIEINIKPATRGGAMVVGGKIKLTKPAEPPTETMMFASESGELLGDDPRQMQLDLRVVPDLETTPIHLKTA
jgi:hypothetical protein